MRPNPEIQGTLDCLCGLYAITNAYKIALNTEDDAELTVKENATTRGLVSAFTKYSSNRVSSRVVLNRFIGLIS